MMRKRGKNQINVFIQVGVDACLGRSPLSCVLDTWGTVGMATLHTGEGAVEGLRVLAGEWTGGATGVVPPLAQLLPRRRDAGVQLVATHR